MNRGLSVAYLKLAHAFYVTSALKNSYAGKKVDAPPERQISLEGLVDSDVLSPGSGWAAARRRWAAWRRQAAP